MEDNLYFTLEILLCLSRRRRKMEISIDEEYVYYMWLRIYIAMI